MNPGPAEEAGKAAGTFMEVMKSQPLSLALVVMNIALLGILFYIANLSHDNRTEDRKVTLEMSKLLAHCMSPSKQEP